MRAPIVWDLQQQINNPFSKKIKKVLQDNPFTDITVIVVWLNELFKKKITGRKRFPSFTAATTPEIKTVLESGDVFYRELFKTNEFINEHTEGKELPNPLTTVVDWIYGRLFLNERLYHESLTIYHELQDFVQSDSGKALAVDPQLQTFQKWLSIYNKLEVEHAMHESWFNSIPQKSIAKEKKQFLELKKDCKLAEIANLYVSSRNNARIAKDYLSRLRQLKGKPPYEFIKEATRSSEYVHFKLPTAIQGKLAYRLGMREYLQFVDLLKYPMVQDYALLFVNDLNDFTTILKYILSTVKLKTKKEFLVLMALQNYFNFLFHTLNDLNGIAIQKYNQKDEARAVNEKAKSLYQLWLTELIPRSFDELLDIFFKKRELLSSKYFLLFFQWINSYSKLYLTNSAMNPKKELIDLLNESFQKRLDENKKERHFLIDRLDVKKLNYEGLKKLVSIHYENKSDIDFRDKLYTLYLSFINSEDFHWHAEGNIDFNEAINIPYYFSLVLESYSDTFGRWNSVFTTNKVQHEGWKLSKADYKLYSRESFLLSSGIGIAHSKYVGQKVVEGKEILFEVLSQLISQHRHSSGSKTIDYLTPLVFATITIRDFAKDVIDEFISLLCQGLDDLKIILRCLYELIDNGSILMTIISKRQISKRIKNEFWIIENSKSDRELHELRYYSKIKEEIKKAIKTG